MKKIVCFFILMLLVGCGSSSAGSDISDPPIIAPAAVDDLDDLQRLFLDVRGSVKPDSLEEYALSLGFYCGKDKHVGENGRTELKIAYDPLVAKVRSADPGDHIYVCWDTSSLEMIYSEYLSSGSRIRYNPGSGYVYSLYNVEKSEHLDCLEAFGVLLHKEADSK